jgi:hypothetical protein
MDSRISSAIVRSEFTGKSAAGSAAGEHQDISPSVVPQEDKYRLKLEAQQLKILASPIKRLTKALAAA